MGYYIRVLGTRDPDIHIDTLSDALKAAGLSARLNYDPAEQPDRWTLLDVANDNGEALAQIERNPVMAGELGQEEIDEFSEQIKDCKPASAVKWLTKYFEKVKVIYAFLLLNAAFEDENFEIVTAIKEKIADLSAGILQADNEGFSNEKGYHILWQFPDNASGEWDCAVKNWLGKWHPFTMDLGDPVQRREFQNGKVPEKAIRL